MLLHRDVSWQRPVQGECDKVPPMSSSSEVTRFYPNEEGFPEGAVRVEVRTVEINSLTSSLINEIFMKTCCGEETASVMISLLIAAHYLRLSGS